MVLAAAGPSKADDTRGREPTPELALAVYALVLVTAVSGGILLQGQGSLAPLLAAELGFILLPTLAAAVWRRLAWRETFRLYLPARRGLLGAALIGASAWAVAAGTLVRLAPPPPEFIKAMLDSLLLDGRTPLWFLLLVAAALPAVCEELLFRGLILSGLRPLGRWTAITPRPCSSHSCTPRSIVFCRRSSWGCCWPGWSFEQALS
jgi:sodium transport system permease protein